VMDGSVPPFVPYDVTAARRLKNQFENLRTFGEVAAWDGEAQEEIDRMRRSLDGLSATEALVAQMEAAATRAHGNKTFLKRTFTTAPEVIAAGEWRKQAAAHGTELSELIEELEAGIDKTPNSPEEQNEMVRELKLVKKERTWQPLS